MIFNGIGGYTADMDVGKFLIVFLARDRESGRIYQNAFISPVGMDERGLEEFAREAGEEFAACYPNAMVEAPLIRRVADAQL